MEKITILITDDHTLIRQSWSYILNADERFQVVAEASSGEEAIEIVRNTNPNVVIMDINLPGMSGIEACSLIREISPGTKVLGVSMHTQPAYAKTMIKKGASGYITKNSPRFELYRAVIEIHNNRTYVCNEIKGLLVDQMIEDDKGRVNVNPLSKKEIEVVGFIKTGYSSREIAVVLGISVKTVEAHRYNVLKKLQLKNTAAMLNHLHTHPIAF